MVDMPEPEYSKAQNLDLRRRRLKQVGICLDYLLYVVDTGATKQRFKRVV